MNARTNSGPEQRKLKSGHGAKAAFREGVTEGDIRKITGRLRNRGSGRHWIERFRGRVYLWVSGRSDAELVLNEFQEEVESWEELA
jgi:hypothetical protein